MKPSTYILKVTKTQKQALNLAFKVLDTYLSVDEVKKCLESPKNKN